ncbi:hypothetical protein ACQRBO_14715 [Segatella copri]|uniref:hypothetical protein n=1 Tax=Segatella copri TaxID=165179 RepID=UPI003D00ED95
MSTIINGLNPCCNGRWSRTYGYDGLYYDDNHVLILVVMEDGLVPHRSYDSVCFRKSGS